MRSDHALYTVAAIFFILTGAVYYYQTEYRELFTIATVILGLFFIGLGYTQRPKTTATPTTTTQITPKEEEKILPETLSVVIWNLTEIKGIGAKRAEQLKALGIRNIEDLAKASAEDLASKLRVSPKITKRWIEDARKFLERV